MRKERIEIWIFLKTELRKRFRFYFTSLNHFQVCSDTFIFWWETSVFFSSTHFTIDLISNLTKQLITVFNNFHRTSNEICHGYSHTRATQYFAVLVFLTFFAHSVYQLFTNKDIERKSAYKNTLLVLDHFIFCIQLRRTSSIMRTLIAGVFLLLAIVYIGNVESTFIKKTCSSLRPSRF